MVRQDRCHAGICEKNGLGQGVFPDSFYIKKPVRLFQKLACFFAVGLLLAASAHSFDGRLQNGFVFAGYSDDLDFEDHTLDFNLGVVYEPVFYSGAEIGFGMLHMQVNLSGNHQTVSDDELLHLAWCIAWGVPLLSGSLAYNTEVPAYVFLVSQYLFNGYIYLPVLLDDRIGVVNKNRLVSQLFSYGFEGRSFTYQDDLGVRFRLDVCSDDGRSHDFCKYDIDFGARISQRFDGRLVKGLFVQVGL